ncbi:chemotaxis protein CheD [Geothermobacter hydrogeniphilus]|uniref:Probable chemoreceptor glutamine deamidase CheD n=1 Tax=Geothermobacter hydrogeniphilus TaxID=1969733 RepID=A0A2K2HCU4_9BACT|nr:chemotaxis protein CheD [Geothermobacter hydrogeniphilus]PNU21107.1 chemotaxis protein CheD [Geothermobacter hydrogeniphilus]
MSDLVLGIGDFGASATSGCAIKTYALGSCVAVIMLDPRTRTIGMIHIALPDSKINPSKVRERPGYFADTGLPRLLEKMVAVSGNSNTRSYVVKLAGGASIMDPNDTFNIGKRNVLAAKKILWANGMGPVAEDVGANYSRTVTVSVDTGEVTISCPGRGQWKI